MCMKMPKPPTIAPPAATPPPMEAAQTMAPAVADQAKTQRRSALRIDLARGLNIPR